MDSEFVDWRFVFEDMLSNLSPSQDGRKTRVIRQHGHQSWDVFQFWGQSGPNNIIRSSHALDNVAADVGMRLVCTKENRLPRFQLKDIEEVDNEDPNVTRKLVVQSKDKSTRDIVFG